MIKEQFVSFETAKMLKEAGFDEVCRSAYYATGNSAVMHERNSMLSHGYISRPTQALASRWLREVHGIHVVITEEAYTNGINYLWQVLIYNPLSVDCWDNKSTGMYGDNGEYKTYEEALEAGLKYVLELIKK